MKRHSPSESNMHLFSTLNLASRLHPGTLKSPSHAKHWTLRRFGRADVRVGVVPEKAFTVRERQAPQSYNLLHALNPAHFNVLHTLNPEFYSPTHGLMVILGVVNPRHCADSGGLKYAWESFEKKHSPSESDKRLFFVAMGQTWCSKVRHPRCHTVLR